MILKKNKFIRSVYMNIFNKKHLIMNDDINLNEVINIQNKIIQRIRKQNKIKVAFFISTAAKWKYEYLYRLMENDPHFEPSIVIVPMLDHGKEFMLQEMLNTYTFFNDYSPIKTYDENTSTYLDIKKEFIPDVIFYSEPYNFIGSEYFITNFYMDSLCCHVQYAFMTSSLYQDFFNRPFHNLLWAFFVETEFHKQYSKKYALNRASNVHVTGYPGCDIFLDKEYKPQNMWSKASQNQLKVIWAPHHTIDEDYGSSNFLELYEVMLQIANDYKNNLFIVFKPHPNLKPRLYKNEAWGKLKTDNYYNLWSQMENTLICTDHYADLFLTSDALIHDSSSFIVEYLYVNKPVLFVYKSQELLKEKNPFGLKALDVSYKAYSYNDLKNFVENVIIEGKDYKKMERELFINNYLIPPHGNFASKNIFNYLCDTLI